MRVLHADDAGAREVHVVVADGGLHLLEVQAALFVVPHLSPAGRQPERSHSDWYPSPPRIAASTSARSCLLSSSNTSLQRLAISSPPSCSIRASIFCHRPDLRKVSMCRGHMKDMILSGSEKRGRSFLRALKRSSTEPAFATTAMTGPSCSFVRASMSSLLSRMANRTTITSAESMTRAT